MKFLNELLNEFDDKPLVTNPEIDDSSDDEYDFDLTGDNDESDDIGTCECCGQTLPTDDSDDEFDFDDSDGDESDDLSMDDEF